MKLTRRYLPALAAAWLAAGSSVRAETSTLNGSAGPNYIGQYLGNPQNDMEKTVGQFLRNWTSAHTGVDPKKVGAALVVTTLDTDVINHWLAQPRDDGRTNFSILYNLAEYAGQQPDPQGAGRANVSEVLAYGIKEALTKFGAQLPPDVLHALESPGGAKPPTPVPPDDFTPVIEVGKLNFPANSLA